MSLHVQFSLSAVGMSALIAEAAELLNVLPDNAVIEVDQDTRSATITYEWETAEQAVSFLETKFRQGPQ